MGERDTVHALAWTEVAASALSQHFQEVLGIDGQPEECAVIIGNWFSTRGRSSAG